MAQTLSQHGLGASEIPMVAGLSPFGTAWDVYEAKVSGRPKPTTEAMEWGLRLEPAIRGKYCDDTGHRVIVPRRSLFHPDRPWQRATPDGMVYLNADELDLEVLSRMAAEMLVERSPDLLLQAKNVSEWMGRTHWDGVPDYVQAQVQWEMSVTGAKAADVAALVGGRSYYCERVHRDESLISDLLAVGEEFVQRTARGLKPEIDHTAACRAHFQNRMKSTANIEVQASPEAEAAIARWRKAHIAAGDAEQELETARNLVRAVIADSQAASITWSGGTVNVRGAYETRTTDYKLVAQLVASARQMPTEEFEALVRSASTTTQIGATIAAPKEWRKK